MKDRPYVLVAALVGALALAIAAAWYFGSAQKTPITATTATQTFRAKSGTQRENARALVSSREHVDGKEGTGTAPVEVWGRLGEGGEPSPGGSPERSRRLADEVLADLGVEEGLAVLQVELERTDAPSALYAAVATLYARSQLYDNQRVEDAFALALSTAQTSDERINVIYRQAKVYLERGRASDLLELLKRTRPEAAAFSTRAAEIEIMRANALWSVNELTSSMATLEALLSRSEIDEMLNEPEFVNVYRQAVTRLIRLYRETGNDSKADALSSKVRSKLRN